MAIDDLYIAVPYRGRGNGKRMMEYLTKFAEHKGYKRIQLHAELSNERGHNLYRKIGFNEEEMMFFMKQVELER
ncbi:Acetyltransferase (GNAT) family protein [Anaerovirgula multivorans]|uniref:Acetyltransferase (GNAT) family protein n=1 Tax=Anaerovirgula multivorans TaxID=312168 RepID=A0A239GUC3_9FIRM|nr:GNAT family N-acetyltransferase [Anaerovirgula multivorans]SNS72388.1 Acetyltransferase (GNAT) family protein [Anaerovirgula multivorans]